MNDGINRILREAEKRHQEAREARLPKWAQAKLAGLRRELNEARALLSGELVSSPLGWRCSINEPMPLPAEATIHYEKDMVHRYSVRWNPDGTLILMHTGVGRMFIIPEASNHFRVIASR